MSASYLVTEAVVLSDTRGSSLMWISHRSVGAHTAVFPLYVCSISKAFAMNLYTSSANISQAHEHHRSHLQSLPKEELGYPLEPTGDAAEVSETQRVTDEPLAQR
jgi:hypothetical protein